MENPIIEKLKQSIDKDYLAKFSLETLKEEMFIPIHKQNDTFLVGVVEAENKERRNSILAKIIITTKLKPKVIPLTFEQFEDILNSCSQYFYSDDTNLPYQVNSSFIQQVSDKITERKKIGEYLLQSGSITQEQLVIALAEAKQAGVPVGSVLVKSGYISIEQLREALTTQLGIDYIDTKDLEISPAVIKLLPEDFIIENKAVPISSDGKSLKVGMVNPRDMQALNSIVYLTGLRPIPLVLTYLEYEKCVSNYFQIRTTVDQIIDEIQLENENVRSEDDSNLWQQMEKELEDESSVVAKLASNIITEAIKQKASDVHIEPRNDNYIVRYRIDGILRKMLDVPVKIENLLISRFKVLSRMNIAEHRRAQDGHFSLKYYNRLYDLRLNTLPVGQREKMVIRILQPDLRVSSDEIQLKGATKQDMEKIEVMISSPHGIILTSGPTGSGKTTTLYSILSQLNSEMVNITTIEDPVEIKLEGINQVQVNNKADITFANSIRTILRQDPDIIMLGEIRDLETLEAAIDASLTGHLVLSTIHANSATATIIRLIEMGAAPHLIATSLVGIVAQRLIRRLCPLCKELYVPKPEELKFIIPSQEIQAFQEHKIYKAKGCENCNHTGYLGRIGLYEILRVNTEIKKLITTAISVHDVQEVAASCGMKTLQKACLAAIVNGEVTISEYLRVLGVSGD